ncbi:hypothetical protein U6A24_01135 [Aquimarina gracilis]|uniref:DUF998 domain-containing protein n=1 Tax=Aquimarina gracilis TaxID=874422 RepID=A0ABU5ZS06_9FLAO|nr:hypothetical protein [Aquimarina gracilis]MEB3344041.1 hypothetical protein [Aquimarina gracilis]
MEDRTSLYSLRKTIGILGLALPILLLVTHQDLLASMSHYYYTAGSVFFILILSAFGLILINYKGYPKKEGELLSDRFITTAAGICILITVLIPTKSEKSLGTLFFTGSPYLFGHESNGFLGAVHLLSAGLFLFLLGYMSFFKFVLNHQASESRNRLFKRSGIIVWASVGTLVMIFALEAILGINFDTIIPAYTFWIEWVALYAFAVAWLVKGRIHLDLEKMIKTFHTEKSMNKH